MMASISSRGLCMNHLNVLKWKTFVCSFERAWQRVFCKSVEGGVKGVSILFPGQNFVYKIFFQVVQTQTMACDKLVIVLVEWFPDDPGRWITVHFVIQMGSELLIRRYWEIISPLPIPFTAPHIVSSTYVEGISWLRQRFSTIWPDYPRRQLQQSARPARHPRNELDLRTRLNLRSCSYVAM